MVYSAVVLEKDKEYLLQLRDNSPEIPCGGMWGLFGGSIDEGESPRDAAVREIWEELNVKINPKDLVYMTEVPGGHVYYLKWDKDLVALDLREGKDMRYFEREEIFDTSNLIPSVKRLMKESKLIEKLV